MSTTRAVKNKIQGKVKQAQGEINQIQGNGVKGGMQKMQGKIQEKMGDIELNATKKKK